MRLEPLALLLLLMAMGGNTVRAQQAIGLQESIAGVRGYEDHPIVLSPTANVQTLTQPSSEPERTTLGSPMIVAIIVGCIAVVAFAIGMAYYSKNRDPTTPRESDLAAVSVVSTKSIGTKYRQSYDRPTGKTPKLRTHEPHSPKMPPPPPIPHHIPPPPQRRFVPHSPPHSPRVAEITRPTKGDGEEVVVVAM